MRISIGIIAWLLVIFEAFLSPSIAAEPAPSNPAVANPPASPEAVRFFEAKVRPVLVVNCYQCHGESKQEDNLRLDSRAGIIAGGDQGPAVVPGNPDESLLIKAVKHSPDLSMPPKKQLASEQIADLTLWVKSGAVWPDDGKTAAAPPRKGMQITAKDRAHWAFQPVKEPPIPTVKNAAWVTNSIDAFILARLEAKGLSPNLPADKRQLVRRLYYDLTGLPPTPAEVEAFVADSSPGAYDALVDRLLESPHYGEKWGRNWLDLVRYAETNSYERDDAKPNVWRYRDYVIRSLNEDKPYDQFVREQLAGDELSPPTPDSLIATGYYRLGIWDDEPADRDLARYNELDDIVATTSQVFLGLTVDCARCHDHKIDPIPQKDYYKLVSFFQNVNPYHNGGPSDELPIMGSPEDRAAYEQAVRELDKNRNRVHRSIVELDEKFRRLYLTEKKLAEKKPDSKASAPPDKAAAKPKPDFGRLIQTDGERILGKEDFQRYQQLRADLDALVHQKPQGNVALGVSESGPQAPDTFVLLRGNPQNKGDKVEPGFLTVLGDEKAVVPKPSPEAKTTGRRTALANWITKRENPLTARVMVNRVWQYHFGRGIVRSPNNFGTQGDRPTHPELLDWLASEFVRQGWRLKPLHRMIVRSSAYRMSSAGNAQALALDPLNDLFWRFDMRRLTAEEVRDSILAVSGRLNSKMFGPSVFPEIQAEVLAGESVPGKGWGKSSPEDQSRRSIYVHEKRSLPLPLLEAFDLGETDRTNPVRFSTTQPTQSLQMLNGPFLNEQTAALAARLRKEAGGDVRQQVRLALNLVTDRPPRDEEIERGMKLIETLRSRDGASEEAALRLFCLMTLNLNEFIYVD
jgi:mono/diheme cytochrome c family protein